MSLDISEKLEKLRRHVSPTVDDLDTFTLAYLECALWSSTDFDGNPLDDDYGLEDLSRETLLQAVEECRSFQDEHWNNICQDVARAGRDFWLTRNGHGAGFWNGDWEDKVGIRLTKAAKVYGSVDLYVGDDGKIYS